MDVVWLLLIPQSQSGTGFTYTLSGLVSRMDVDVAMYLTMGSLWCCVRTQVLGTLQ